jgi:anti-sigma factor RsiW
VAPKLQKHLNGEEAERYSLGAMSEEEAAHWEEHLLVCETCRREVAASDAYVAAMRAAAKKLRKGTKKARGA